MIGLYALAAVLIGVNWFLYVYSVNNGFIVESSLGYFITPLVNVLMGVVVFRERLRQMQWVAVAFAFSGVVWLTLAYGTLPWIGLALAGSFGSYGLVKKKAPLPSLEGLAVETAVLLVPAALYLMALHGNGTGAFLHSGATTDLLLVAGRHRHRRPAAVVCDGRSASARCPSSASCSTSRRPSSSCSGSSRSRNRSRARS